MASPYTGNPSAVQSPSPAPGPNVAPIVSLPADTDGATWANLYQAIKVATDGLTWTWIQALGSVFGSGVDGNVTFDGTATVLGLAPATVGSSKVYTLTRDIFCKNLTVTGANTILFAANFRIFVNGILTTASGASISGDGISGAAAGTGFATAAGTVLGAGSGGTNGSGGGNGGNGSSVTNSYGGTGGNGGNGGVGGGTGGTGGSVTRPVATLGSPFAFSASTVGYLVGQISGTPSTVGIFGGAGSGGAGDSSVHGNSGGGGSGGGVLCIVARLVALTSAADIHAAGGNGGNATGTGGGGAGGGGGGVIILAYGSKGSTTFTGTNTIGGATANCAGGNFGAGINGSAGFAGSAGTLFEIALT